KQEIEPFRACASYNGKTFDLPILRTRFVMTLRSEVTVDESHLDLLHPARRLWRDRFGSTTLRQLEESVLDDGRVTDIPGSLIPDAYFYYLRPRDPDARDAARPRSRFTAVADAGREQTPQTEQEEMAAAGNGKLTIRPLTAARVDDVKTVTRGTWGATCWDLFPRFNAKEQRVM